MNSGSLGSEPALANVGCEEFHSCGRGLSPRNMEETPPLDHRIPDQEGDTVPHDLFSARSWLQAAAIAPWRIDRPLRLVVLTGDCSLLA